MRKTNAICALLPLLVLLGGCEPGAHVLYGFMDAQGHWVVPPEYDDAQPFSGGLAAVKKGDRWGFVDREGRRVIEPVFQEARSFTEGLAAVHAEGGWMFIDTAGKAVITGPFEDALPFEDGLAAIVTDGKWGFVDREGRRAIRAGFDELDCRPDESFLPAAPRCFREGLAAARLGERWGYIDRHGRWSIEPRFEAARSFAEGLAAACEPVADDACRFGYLDRRGRWAIPPRFLSAMHFSGGRAIAMVERNGSPPAPGPAGAGGPAPTARTAILLDAAGREIADLDWEPLIDNFGEVARIVGALAPDYLAEGLVPATEGSRWGYRDRDGQWRIQPQYAFAMPFRHGVAAVGLTNDPAGEFVLPDRWDLVDPQGRRIGLPGLTMLGGGAGPLFPAQLHSRWGLLDRDGRWPVLPVYAEDENNWLDLPIFRRGPGDGLYRMGVHANHRWLVADTRGRRLAAGEYQWVSELRHPQSRPVLRLSFLQNGLWGLADVRLEPIAPAGFDRIVAGADESLVVTLAGHVGCMDRSGRWIVPAEFDEIDNCGRDRVQARRGAVRGTWTRQAGWTPSPGADEPPATAAAHERTSVWFSNDVHWRRNGSRYHLFRAGVESTDVEPADEVRRAAMASPDSTEPRPFAVVRRGAAWFVLGEDGRPRLPASYDGIGSMFDGLVAVRRADRWGIVDARGRDVFPGQDHELQPFTRDVAIFCRDGRCGLMHRDGRVLLEAGYTAITPFSRTRAWIRAGDRIGVVDRRGRVLVEPIYSRIEAYSTAAWAATHPQGLHLLSTATGRPLPGLDHLSSLVEQRPFAAKTSEGLAAAIFRVGDDQMRSGYLDEAGRIAIPPRFDRFGGAEPFSKGAALVTIDGRCGAIDRRGRLILPTGYDHCSRLSNGSILAGAEAGAPPLEPFLKTAPAGLPR